MATFKNDGKSAIATRIILGTVAAFGYQAVSENSDAEVSTGTTLTGEITDSGLARAASTCTNPSSYVFQLVNVWTATGTKSLRKWAGFNAASGGNMLFEHLSSVIKGVEDGETFTATTQGTVSA